MDIGRVVKKHSKLSESNFKTKSISPLTLKFTKNKTQLVAKMNI